MTPILAIDPGTAESQRKQARAAYAREWRKRNPGYDKRRGDRSEYHKSYNSSEQAKEAQRKYKQSKKGRETEAKRRHDPETAIKRSARWAVKAAVKKGTLVVPPGCSQCGKDRDLQAHHTDYTKPLRVTWLCVRCHAKEHTA